MDVTVEIDSLKSEDEMPELLACRGCLEKDGLLDLREKRLEQVYVELTGLPVSSLDMPMLACALCLHQLRKFGTFRARCLTASYALQQVYYHSQSIESSDLNTIDTKHLKYNLIKTEIEVSSFVPSKPKPKRARKRKIAQNDITHTVIQQPEEVFVDIKENTIKKQESLDDDDFQLVPDDLDAPIVTVSNLDTTESLTEPDNDSNKSDNDDYDPGGAASAVEEEDDDDDDFVLSDIVKKEKANVKTRKSSRKTSKLKKSRKSISVTSNEVEDKGKSKKRKLKERSEDKQLIKEIGETFKKMWRWKTEEKMDIFRMFEKIHEESNAVKNGDSGGCKCEPKHKKGMVCVKQELRIFLDYVEKLSELYNVDVEFLSVEGQKREIEDRRKSVEYIEAQYKCELCCKIFNFPDTYKRHMASHDVHPGDVECEICRYRFKRHASLMSHIHTMHSKKLKCKECGFVNRTWNLAKEHYDFHQGIAPVCHLCGKNFTEKKHYLMHLRQVHRAQVATTLCLLCGDSFNGPTGLRIHMDRSHRQAAKCPSCDGWFLNGEMLSTHLDNADGGCKPGHSSCTMCGANFSSEELMWQHHDEQHIKEYKCEECNKSYAGLRKYKWHVENKHAKGRRRELGKPRKKAQDYKGNKNFVCDICGKDDFPVSTYSNKHAKGRRRELGKPRKKAQDYKGNKNFVCDICGKDDFPVSTYSNKHAKGRRRELGKPRKKAQDYKGNKNFVCDICGKDDFPVSTYSNIHAKGRRRELGKPSKKAQDYKGNKNFVCDICGKDDFPVSTYSNIHAKGRRRELGKPSKKAQDYKGNKNFVCDICGKDDFPVSTYSNIHAKGRRRELGKPRKKAQDYKGNKNFVCDICGKDDFPFLSTLRFHQRKHTDEKPHECSICRKTFKEKLNLKVHMTIHTDERRYQCPYCPKAFRQFSHRTVHIRTHTKEKPYSCSICQKQFSHRSVMLEHIRTVHEGQPPRRRQRHDKQLD